MPEAAWSAMPGRPPVGLTGREAVVCTPLAMPDVRPDLSVHSAIVISEQPARLVPLPAGNPNIDT